MLKTGANTIKINNATDYRTMIERIPQTPPTIAPLPAGTIRPIWSVMIPVYNCYNYLSFTLKSVLEQYPGADKMEIEVVDDHSTDGNVEALVNEIGKGVVKYHRKEKNMGSIRNFETCINRSSGHMVHILHGDDMVKPGFYKEIEQLFENYPDAGAAFTDFFFIDDKGEVLYSDNRILDKPGVIHDAMELIGSKQRIQPPAMVVKRSVYEKLGSFYAVKYGEDWEMWARIAAQYPIAHSPEYLACYRVHNANISADSLATGQNIKDINKVIDLIQHHLPKEKRVRLKKQAKENFSVYYAWMSHKLYHDHKDTRGALAQINGAIKMSLNKTTLMLALKLYAKLLIGYRRLR